MKLINLFFLNFFIIKRNFNFTQTYAFSSKKPFFSYNTNQQIFRYRSNERKIFKKNKKYFKGLVQDHHCIPKQHRYHPTILKINFDINSPSNLMIMPTEKGIKDLNLNPDSLIHNGGHNKYNNYVKYNLDYLFNKSDDELKYEFWLFMNHLKKNMFNNCDNIPWK